MGFSRPEYWSGQPFPSPGDFPNPEIEPRSPALQVNSLPAEPQGKPKNIGVGSLSLFQQIFQTQELSQGLWHCRQILYQLSYKGRPDGWTVLWSGHCVLCSALRGGSCCSTSGPVLSALQWAWSVHSSSLLFKLSVLQWQMRVSIFPYA